MIRDPSDGTVREKPVLDVETSGLPISRAKAEYLARLEASREWLENWHHRKTELRSPDSGEG